MIMESQVSGLAKLGLAKLVSFPNLDQESHAMRLTCIIILIILHTTHNILHIAHNILHIAHNFLHIIHSYAMRPWNHGLDIKTSQKRGLNIWYLNQEVCFSKHRVYFIHSYVLHFISFMGQCKHQLYLGSSLRLSLGSLCNEQE